MTPPERFEGVTPRPVASTGYAAIVPDAEILITGVEDPGTRAHGANESLHLATFERACLAEALLLRNLAAAG